MAVRYGEVARANWNLFSRRMARPWTNEANASDPQGLLYHTLRVFLIDREGRIRNIYSSGTLDPRLVVADVKTLLLEEARLSKQ